MVENVPVSLLSDFMKTFSWALTNGSLEEQLRTQLQLWTAHTLLQQQQNQNPLLISPTVSPIATSSSEATTPTVSPTVTPPKKVSKKSPMHSPNRSSDLNRNTYSDCEKKHFLDVAYENNWGTTVAANKFTRIWGKGPTRRMFYWWREQFKKEHDREQRQLDELRERKTELSLELAELSNSNQLLSEKAPQCIQQIAVADTEIANILAKRQKNFCTITGEACAHGDGLQEETAIVRKFTTPFICEYCKMPFQKENTCYIHMRLCQTRFIAETDKKEEPEEKKAVPIAIPSSDAMMLELSSTVSPPIQLPQNTELTELAEQLIARLAAYTAPVV